MRTPGLQTGGAGVRPGSGDRDPASAGSSAGHPEALEDPACRPGSAREPGQIESLAGGAAGLHVGCVATNAKIRAVMSEFADGVKKAKAARAKQFQNRGEPVHPSPPPSHQRSSHQIGGFRRLLWVLAVGDRAGKPSGAVGFRMRPFRGVLPRSNY